ncbi:MAG: NB-ARC domain-containing protein [Thermosynechococcaceae cyanobacterium]
MDVEEAIGLVETILGEDRLSKLQIKVLEQVWVERSYQEIATSIGYEVGYIKQTGSQLWRSLSQAFGEKITKNNVQFILSRKVKETLEARRATKSTPETDYFRIPVTDWGEAADVASFQGRHAELERLEQWIERDRCRLIGLFGMGGIGKTSLSVKLAQRLEHRFEAIIWRSLRNAPTIETLLADILQFLSPLSESPIPSVFDEQRLRLLTQLRNRRCLIVLDNMETVLQSGDRQGGYQPGYDGYGQLLKCIGETSHQSTFLLTSREKPKGFAIEEGINWPIRSLALAGLSEGCIQEVLTAKGHFFGSRSAWKVLNDRYAGNPLALKMVASVIQDCFGGNLETFLEMLRQSTCVFGDIRDLLVSQIHRLSGLEQQVMYWLAIAREPVTLADLQTDLQPHCSLTALIEALTALERRSLIETATPTWMEQTLSRETAQSPRFTLQPVVMEFMTEQLVNGVCVVIEKFSEDGDGLHQPNSASESSFAFGLLKSHALMKAQAKDYIREAQYAFIVKPTLERLQASYHSATLIGRFQAILATLRRQLPQSSGYVAGNLLNLLAQMSDHWQDWDFSALAVRQAYLARVHLHRFNFQGADLAQSVFTQTCGQILSLAFSPDDRYLATGDVNHELHLWHVADGKRLFTSKIDEGWIWSVAFSPDGRWVASGANRAVHLWDVETGECLQKLDGYSDRVFSVAFSPNGQWLATGSEDRLVRVWEVETGQLRHVLSGHQSEVRSVAFAALPNPSGLEGYLLASGSFDGTIRLWDAQTGVSYGILSSQSAPILSLAFSPDGNLIASSGGDRVIRLWSVPSGELLRTLKGHLAGSQTVVFSPDGKTLASGSDDRTVRIWHTETGRCLRVLQGHRSWISAIAFSPKQGLLASGSEDQSIRLWDSQANRCLKTFQGYSNGIWCVVGNAQGTQLASGSQDRTIRLWDWATGRILRCLNGHTSWVWTVAFSPDGAVLASGSEDRTIKLWDAATGQLHHTLKGHDGAVFSVVFSTDGQTLYSCSLDGTIKCWDRTLGICLRTLVGHEGSIWSLALSRDGEILASSSLDGTLKLWNVATASCVRTLSDRTRWIRCCDISPNRQRLVSGSADGYLKVWDLSPVDHPDTSFSAHCGPVLSVAFAPDGKTFASCGADNLIKLWDSETLCRLKVLVGHTRWVRCVTYSTDGQTLISCGQDETIRLWTVATGHCSAVLRSPRPYEGTKIDNATGLTPIQKDNLKQLGAIEESVLLDTAMTPLLEPNYSMQLN